jgi:hypothetical protein
LIFSVVTALVVATKERYAVIVIPYLALIVGFAAKGLSMIDKKFLKIAALLPAIFCGISIASFTKNYTHVADRAEIHLTKFLQEQGYSRGISGYHTATRIMFYSDRKIIISSLAGPYYITRFIDVEKTIARSGAKCIIVKASDEDRLNGWKKYLTKNHVEWRSDRIDDVYEVIHSFSRPVYSGENLTKEERKHYIRHLPENPIKQVQYQANVLFRK